MLDTLQIYQELSETLGQPAAQKLASLLGVMYRDLQQTVTKDDFRELKQTVSDLASAQQRTEERLGGLTERVDALAAAQQRTEQRVEELAAAQQRTEQRVEELALAMQTGFAEVNQRFALVDRRFDVIERRLELLDRRFGVLGSRWGDGAEEAFRQGLLEMVRDLGYTVEHYQGQDPDGFINYTPRSFDLDVLVRDGEVVVAEIKSNASGADVAEFHRSVQLYERQTGRRATKRVLVAVTIQAMAITRAQELGVIVATGFETLEPRP